MYTLKTNLAHKENYGKKRNTNTIKYIVLHYTANDGDSDEANANYFKNNIVKASAHYFVDDNSVTQSVPDNYVAYSVGGNKYSNTATTGGGKYHKICTNSNSISVELCDYKRNGKYDFTENTLQIAAELVHDLMIKYDVPIERVIRHFEITGKNCPAPFVENSAAWESFKIRVNNVPSSWAKEAVDWASKNDILYGDDKGDYKLSDECTRQQMITFIHRLTNLLKGS